MTLNASMSHWLLGAVSLDSGDLQQARRSMEEAVRLSEVQNEAIDQGLVRMWLGRVLYRVDAPEAAAEQTILEALADVHARGMRPFEAQGHILLGEGYIITGQKEKALASLNKAREMFQEMGMDYYLARTERALEKLKAS